jgi:hypothetical protein
MIHMMVSFASNLITTLLRNKGKNKSRNFSEMSIVFHESKIYSISDLWLRSHYQWL